MKKMGWKLVLLGLFCCFLTFSFSQSNTKIKHIVVANEEGRFHGWPANNGIWLWGDEILVGFTQGDYTVQDGHNISGIEESKFARSKDGGETWSVEDPENFLDDANEKWLPAGKKYLSQPLNFKHKDFAFRVFATGYHGNDDPQGGFYYSYTRGKTWDGPYFLGNLAEIPEFTGYAINARTDYIILGRRKMALFVSITKGKDSRIAYVETSDGGMSFDFISWITPEDAGVRHIMNQTIQLDRQRYLLAYRRISKDKTTNSIESFISHDRGRTWQPRGTIKSFLSSSNPPALVKLKDGRVACVYGDRHHSVMVGRYSEDEGLTWGEEFLIRSGFKDIKNTWDFGYPRLVQRRDGKLVCLYYWASPTNQQQHIAASIWPPESFKK